MTRRALIVFLLAAALVGARTWRNLNVPGQPLVELYGLQDFRDNFYYPTVAVLEGRNPYNYDDYRAHYPIDRPLPAYTPINFVVHLPLALLPYPLAEAGDFLMNLGLILLLARLALAGAGVTAGAWPILAFASFLVLSRPGQMTLFLGQSSALMAVGTTLALLHGRRRPLLAALGFALTCLKPSYGMPLAIVMLARGDLTALLSGGGLAALAGLAGALGPMRAAGGPLALVASAQGSMAVVRTDASFHEPTSLIRIDPVAILGRFLGHPMGPVANLVVAVTVLGLAALLLARLNRQGEPEPRPFGNGLGCIAVLLATYHQPYDALVLALPLAAGATALGLGVRARAAFLGLLLVPSANFLATHTLLERLEPAPTLWLVLSTLNGAALLAAYAIWLRWTERRAAEGFSP